MNKKSKQLRVHKDILSEYCSPYYEVEVSRKPKYPAEIYEDYTRYKSTEITGYEDTQYPCGYCKVENPKLIWLKATLTNAGGHIYFEFKCEKCGVYSFYTEQEFS